MKLIHRPTPEYVGWWVQCRHCSSILEVEHRDELTTHTPGDMKDEGTLQFRCPICLQGSHAAYNRLKHDSQVLHRNYKG